MDRADDEITGVPFAPTAEEMAAADQSAEVARLREALREAIEFAEQDYQALTPTGEAMVARWRAMLAAAEGRDA